MKQKLNGQDRLVIPSLLPAESGILKQLAVKEIRAMVELKSEEFVKYGVTEMADGQLSFDKEKIKTEKEFDFSETHVQLLKEAVEKKDKEGKVSQWILDTCLKIQKMG